MKRRFKVTLGNRTYEVEVEEVSEQAKTVATQTPTKLRPAAEELHAEQPKPPADVEEKPTQNEAGLNVISSPLAGVVVSIKCGVGSSVREGDVLLTLEAMKMENEIYAPRSGVVRKIAVAEGAKVSQGDVLILIE